MISVETKSQALQVFSPSCGTYVRACVRACVRVRVVVGVAAITQLYAMSTNGTTRIDSIDMVTTGTTTTTAGVVAATAARRVIHQ